MNKKSLLERILILTIIISSSWFPTYPQEPDISVEMKKWEVIANQLSYFLADPYAGFTDVKRIDDLSYWTYVYEEIYGGEYIKDLFSRHFKAKDIDARGMNIIFCLLDKYSIPANPGIRPIIRRAIEVIQARPEWFFTELVIRPDWKKLLRLIVLDKSTDLKPYCAGISDSYIKDELLSFLEELEEERRTEVQRLEEFLIDPVGNFDKIKNIYFICSTMAIRDRMYVDENKNLPDEYFSPGVIEDYIRENTDEIKVEILLHLISHCTTLGLESEVILELGSEIFFEHPELFVRGLSKYKEWRSIVYLVNEFLYYRDPGFNKIISSLGKTEFESELKRQLVFLRSLRLKEREAKERK